MPKTYHADMSDDLENPTDEWCDRYQALLKKHSGTHDQELIFQTEQGRASFFAELVTSGLFEEGDFEVNFFEEDNHHLN